MGVAFKKEALMLLSDAISGFFLFIRAEGFSDQTVLLYKWHLSILLRFLGDKEVTEIKEHDLRGFFVYLREVYHKEKGHPDKPMSGAFLRNEWKGMRSLFEWCKEQELLKERPDINIKMPGNNPKTIMPLTEDEVKALLKNAEFSRVAETRNRNAYRIKRSTAVRDVALLILLLDTGIRAGECSRLDIKDVDLEKGEIFIKPYGNSGIKTKSRAIPIGKATMRVLWKYKNTLEYQEPNDPFFVSKRDGRRLDRSAMLQLIKSLGDKAGIKNCHPHQLRHTFSIQYLRNGGDVFTLKKILGHNSLKMVEVYLQLAQTDTTAAHRRASPADRWHL
jgi:integrase/recombinase XerD